MLARDVLIRDKTPACLSEPMLRFVEAVASSATGEEQVSSGQNGPELRFSVRGVHPVINEQQRCAVRNALVDTLQQAHYFFWV